MQAIQQHTGSWARVAVLSRLTVWAGLLLTVMCPAVCGQAPLDPVIELNNSSSVPLVFSVTGRAPTERLPASIAHGDIDGDGYDDAILGAQSTASEDYWKVYIVYGAADRQGKSILMSDSAPSPPVPSVIRDNPPPDRGGAGSSVAVGDIDRDGFDDIIIGAPFATVAFECSNPPNPNISVNRDGAGVVYVLYGPLPPGSTVELWDLGTSAQGPRYTIVRGAFKGDHAGSAVSSGDTDGDGYDDVIVGAERGGTRHDSCLDTGTGSERQGEVYVVFGGAALPTLPGQPNFVDLCVPSECPQDTNRKRRIIGRQPGDETGCSVAAGDVDGDGRDDVIVGARDTFQSLALPENRGAVYVVYGGGGNVTLGGSPPGREFTQILGRATGDKTGDAVASGDVNGDGFDDVIIGAPGAGGTSWFPFDQRPGGAYVLYGGANMPDRGSIELSATPASDQTLILGVTAGDWGWHVGDAVASGDVNGDGFDDLIIGAPDSGSRNGWSGTGFVIYGGPGLPGETIEFERNGTGEQDVRVEGGSYWSLGSVVAAGADLDRDGMGEISLGAPNRDAPGVWSSYDQSGLASFVFGDGLANPATAVERDQSGNAQPRGFGGRLSPVVRTIMDYESGTGPGGAESRTTVTLHRSEPRLPPGFDRVLPVYWEIATNRTQFTCDLTFQYTDEELMAAGPGLPPVDETRLAVFRRSSAGGGTWVLAGHNQTVDPVRNELTINALNGFGDFAIVEGPGGACCDATFGCTVVDETACLAGGGTYQGSATTCTPSPCCPPPPTIMFRKIADTNTPVPGGTGTFSQFQEFSLDSGSVAFRAWGGSYPENGIYLGNGTTLRVVADYYTPIPGGTGNFSDLVFPSLDGGTVAFGGYAVAWRGLYTETAGTLTVIADGNTPIPGGPGNFTSFEGVSLEGGNVAFGGSRPGPTPWQGIYTKIGGAFSLVADYNTPIPGGIGNFTGFESYQTVPLDWDNVAFWGSGSDGQSGIYTDIGGSLRVVADTNTPIPGGTGNFKGFGYGVSADLGTVAFFGVGSSGQKGVYIDSWGTLSVLADTNTTVPDGTGRFTRFNFPGVSRSGAGVVFKGHDQADAVGIYASIGGPLRKIIARGDSLDGKIVDHVSLTPNRSLDGHEIAFKVWLDPSGQLEAIYVATVESVSRAFRIMGTSDGIGWSWCINGLPGPGFAVCDLNVPGVLPGGSAADLANQFVDTINASGCSGVQAAATGSVFAVTIGGTQEFAFCVGPFGQHPTCCFPPSSSCSFNPSMEEVVLTGADCNGNGIDDTIDIANGTSDDLNADGVPDECEGQGACCLPNGGCADGLTTAQCETVGGSHQGDGTICATLPDSDGDGVVDLCDVCPGVDDAIFAPDCADVIPTVSEWGLVVITLLLLVGAKVYFGRRRSAEA